MTKILGTGNTLSEGLLTADCYKALSETLDFQANTLLRLAHRVRIHSSALEESMAIMAVEEAAQKKKIN